VQATRSGKPESVGIFVPAETRKARRPNIAFDSIRRELFPLQAAKCEECGTKFWTMNCDHVGEKCKTHAANMCRNDNLCVADSYRRSSELSGDFVRNSQQLSFAAGVKLRFFRWETTMMRDIQERMTLDQAYAFTKEVKNFMEGYLRRIWKIPDGVQLGSAVVFQMLHSSDPFGMAKHHSGADRRHFHYHGVTFAWGVWKDELSIYRFPKNLFIDDSEIIDGEKKRFVKLRFGWRSFVESRLGKSSAKDVDCYIRYESGSSELYHRFRYMMRGNVEDFAKWTRFHGYPVDYDKEWVRQALSWKKGRPRVLYYGFLASKNLSPKNAFMRKVGLAIPGKALRLREARRVYCDKHGEEYRIDFAVGLKDIGRVIAEGGMLLARRPTWMSFGDG
jgi:hypothetical protein